MARPPPILAVQHQFWLLPPPVAFLLIGAAVFSAVTFLCGSHAGVFAGRNGRKETVRLGGDRKKRQVMEKMKSGLSSKALLVAKMVSWRKAEDECEAEEEGEEGGDGNDVVWKKAIIRGEKCRPLDFSGKILYDCDGNRLPD